MKVGLLFTIDTKQHTLLEELKTCKYSYKVKKGEEADTCYLNINAVVDEDKKRFMVEVDKALKLNIVFDKGTLVNHLWIGKDS